MHKVFGNFLEVFLIKLIFINYRYDFVYDLFGHMTLEEEGGGSSGARTFRMERRAAGKKKATVSTQFKVSYFTKHFMVSWIHIQLGVWDFTSNPGIKFQLGI